MSIKLTLKVNSENAVKDATDLTNQLKIKNLRGVKVRQEEAEPTEGALAGGAFLAGIKILIETGFATGLVKHVVDLLKNGFFTTTKQIEAEKEIKLKELELQELTKMQELKNEREIELKKLKLQEQINQREHELKKQELAIQQKSIDLIVECKDKKINVKLTKDDNEEKVLQTLKDFMDC